MPQVITPHRTRHRCLRNKALQNVALYLERALCPFFVNPYRDSRPTISRVEAIERHYKQNVLCDTQARNAW
jgi:hypothetical protein